MRAITIILFCAIVALALCGPAMSSPSLASPRVTPSTGNVGDSFTFTVRYAGELPSSVQLFVNGVSYDMQEVDATDTNTTDGKDYYIRVQLDEGVSIFYFKAILDSGEEARTAASTVNVRPATGIRLDHLDVAIPVLILLIPTAWFLVMFRRLSRDLRRLLEMLEERNRDSE